MASIVPEHDEIKKAVKWVSDALEQNPDEPVQHLVQKAIFDFDLSPLDAEFLLRFFKERAKTNP